MASASLCRLLARKVREGPFRFWRRWPQPIDSVTGTVGSEIRNIKEFSSRVSVGQEVLLTAGNVSIVCRIQHRRRDRLEPGCRISIECSFEFVGGWVPDLPDEWGH